MPYAELIVESIPPQTPAYLCYRKTVKWCLSFVTESVVELERSLIFTAFPVSSSSKEFTTGSHQIIETIDNLVRQYGVLLQDLHLFIYYNKFHVYPFTSAMLACRRNSAN